MTAPRESDRVVNALAAICQPGWTVVQVGCLDAFEAHTIIAGKSGCRAIGFEASPQLFNGVAIFDDVEYHNVAIGATDCEMTYYAHGSPGCGSLYNRGGETMTVPVRRLDTILPELNATPDFLIVDTEGTAHDVLEGAGIFLEKISAVYAECQTSKMYEGGRLLADVAALLAPHGFSMVQSNPTYSAGDQGNYLWLKEPVKVPMMKPDGTCILVDP